MKTIVEYWLDTPPISGPILSRMRADQVFKVQRDGSGFRFTEECDQHFHTTLSREELAELAAELAALAKP